jgi:RHH-type transcriptional regulator, rel operon repressor / antitoxin RelB
VLYCTDMITTTFSVRVGRSTKHRLEKLAKSTGRSRSFLAAEAIVAYLDTNEWQVAGITKALSSLDRGKSIAHSRVSEWVASWGDPQRASCSQEGMTLHWSPECIHDLLALRAHIAEHNPPAAKRVAGFRGKFASDRRKRHWNGADVRTADGPRHASQSLAQLSLLAASGNDFGGVKA